MAPKAQVTAEKTAKAAPKAAKAPVAAASVGSAAAAGIDAETPALQKEESSSPMTPKNFRNHPDMENFFRFIYENDLRLEALHIIDEIIVQRANRRKKGNA